MRNRFGVFALLLAACVLFSSSLYAKPERFEIKSEARRTKEERAKAGVKKVNWAKIQDPEARKAIQELVDYLGLSAQQN